MCWWDETSAICFPSHPTPPPPYSQPTDAGALLPSQVDCSRWLPSPFGGHRYEGTEIKHRPTRKKRANKQLSLAQATFTAQPEKIIHKCDARSQNICILKCQKSQKRASLTWPVRLPRDLTWSTGDGDRLFESTLGSLRYHVVHFHRGGNCFSIMNPTQKLYQRMSTCTIPHPAYVESDATCTSWQWCVILPLDTWINKQLYEKNTICIFKNCWKFNDVWFKLATTGINLHWRGGDGGMYISWGAFWMKMVWGELGIKWFNFYQNFFHVAAEFQSREVHNATLRKKTQKKIWTQIATSLFLLSKAKEANEKLMYMWISSQSQSSLHHHMTWQKPWGW